MKADTMNTETLKAVYKHPESLKRVKMHYCPGCGHGIIHKLLAQCIDELGVREETVIVAPVGCSVLIYNYYNCDGTESAHGRAQAVSTGLKRALPDRTIICYQGDGDLASIGIAEILHAANRGEKFTTIFVNNAVYGMTGGQMAPTTLMGQVTASSPRGRDAGAGFPMKVCEILSLLPGAAYLYRGAVDKPANVLKLRKAIKNAFQVQMANQGFSLDEILAHCPRYWRMEPVEAVRWCQEHMMPAFPLGEIKSVPEA